jgi:hypothetical protein
MAIEYAGFVPTQAINWAELSEDLAGKVYQVGEERQKKRDALDKIATDNQKLLAEFEPGKNQSLRELTLRGADQGRVLIKQWNDQLKAGIISPTDYKNKMNNLMESWGVFAKSAKSYDERYLEVMSRQQPGEDGKVAASAYEVDVLTREFGDMSDLSNKTTHFDNDGRVYMATTDKNTGQIIGDVYDVRTMSYPNNIFANRVYVDDQVNDVVKNWDTKTLFEKAAKGGELTIESAKNQDSYKIMAERLANTIAPDNNPRAQVSILIDNGVIQNPIYYKNDNEYETVKNQAINKLIQEKKSAGIEKTEPTKEELDIIELSIIKNQQGADGIINPVLTKKQRDEARERVKQSVDIQLAEKIQKDMPNIVRGGGGTTAADEKEQQRVNEYQRGYMTSLDAFGLDPQGKKTKQPDLSGLDNSYKYRYVNETIQVYRLNHGKNESPLAIIKSPKGLAQYTVYGKSVAEQEANYELGRTQYRRSKGLDGAPKQDNIPSATRAEWKKSGWTDDQINEAVRLKKIKVI